MRRKPPEPASDRIPNLAPMVDVIMVLLIFFMLGASLQLTREGALSTELDPRSGPGAAAEVAIIPAVSVALLDVGGGAGCDIRVNGSPLTPATFTNLHHYLGDRLKEGADPKTPLVISAESSVRWRFVVRAMDAAVRAGFGNVQFSVSLPRGGAASGGP